MKTLTSALAFTVVTLAPGSASATTYPGVEHNTAKLLQSLEGVPTLDSMKPVDARAALAGAQAALKWPCRQLMSVRRRSASTAAI